LRGRITESEDDLVTRGERTMQKVGFLEDLERTVGFIIVVGKKI
jgi:hypothetical protein